MRAIIPLTVTLFFMAWTSVSALAGTLSSPASEPVLTVSGEITRTNAEGQARFDMQMLRALRSETIETTTIWTEGVQVFEGVPLSALVEHVGATGTVIRASAINDYTVEIPVDSITENAPLIAYARDGAPMSRRKKGPLWIIYPFDSDPDFRSELVYSRSIWQLDRIEFAQ